MWAILADVVVDPKEQNLFWWMLTAFASFITATLGWLVATLKKEDNEQKDLLNKLLSMYDERESRSKEREAEAEGRLTHAWNEHDKDRIAAMHRYDEIALAMSRIVHTLEDK